MDLTVSNTLILSHVKLKSKKCFSYENDIPCEYEEHVKYQKKTLLNRHIHNQEYCLSYNNNIENAFVVCSPFNLSGGIGNRIGKQSAGIDIFDKYCITATADMIQSICEQVIVGRD